MPTPDELKDFIANATEPTPPPRVPPEPPPVEKPVEEKPVDDKKKKDEEEKEELNTKMRECLAEYNGEGNVPHGHDYWKWANQYRALLNKGK